jgi:hypothetical protein
VNQPVASAELVEELVFDCVTVTFAELLALASPVLMLLLDVEELDPLLVLALVADPPAPPVASATAAASASPPLASASDS